MILIDTTCSEFPQTVGLTNCPIGIEYSVMGLQPPEDEIAFSPLIQVVHAELISEGVAQPVN